MNDVPGFYGPGGWRIGGAGSARRDETEAENLSLRASSPGDVAEVKRAGVIVILLC